MSMTPAQHAQDRIGKEINAEAKRLARERGLKWADLDFTARNKLQDEAGRRLGVHGY